MRAGPSPRGHEFVTTTAFLLNDALPPGPAARRAYDIGWLALLSYLATFLPYFRNEHSRAACVLLPSSPAISGHATRRARVRIQRVPKSSSPVSDLGSSSRSELHLRLCFQFSSSWPDLKVARLRYYHQALQPSSSLPRRQLQPRCASSIPFQRCNPTSELRDDQPVGPILAPTRPLEDAQFACFFLSYRTGSSMPCHP